MEVLRQCKAAVSRMPRCHRAGVKSGRSKAPPCGLIAVTGFLLPVSRNTCDDAVLGIGESCILLRGDKRIWFSGICIGGGYAKKVLGKNEDYVLFFHITYDCVMYTEYILKS